MKVSGRARSASEFEFMRSIIGILEPNKWISIVGNDMVAQCDSAIEAFTKAKRKYPDSEPFIMKVPSNAITLF